MADLSKMTRKQLEKLISDAQKALKTLETKEKREAKKAAEKAAAKFGFKLKDLTGNTGPASVPNTPKKASGTKAAAKYANPKDPKQTWTGRGRQPSWYKEEMEKGTDPKTLEV